MINLPVDEAYAFDYLAILYIKSHKNNSDTIQDTISICENAIKKQIGSDLWNEILKSKEFHNILKTNEKVFEVVEKARYGEISAKIVDTYNMNRFMAKKQLQNKFFIQQKITEWKS